MPTFSPTRLLLLVLGLAGCSDAGQTIYVKGDAGDASVEAAADDASTEPGANPSDAGVDAMSSGALCGVNGRDDCGSFAVCTPELGCVECTTDADCPIAAKTCLRGACVGCRPAPAPSNGSSECPASEPACWASDYGCHARCASTSDCPSGTICDEVSGACVGCTSNADCATGICSTLLARCVECESDASCPGQKPRCRLLTSTCVACISNEDCGRAAPICDPTTFTCRVGCTSDKACPGQRCDATTGTCVDLVVDAGAGAGDGG